ncbi:lysophospholipid acyltransferase family protein [Haploplasma modicum]|uniref:lysophospholipid acyltransferase family protein n=1 Tax=Haploplasma modicum TaxID=2150 RepID=UPI00214C729F|nr:lysophospholipid acyltransferase family protein [Haploplasma modicum]MCR1808587.1 1-acyl-sn-glycerol-3-phosphate acyltransferase [Haploplasma modicum]
MSRKKEVKKRHIFIITLAKIFLTIPLKIKYRYTYKKYKDLKDGPYLILGNHTISIDPILMSLSFPFHIYYFATEQIFNLGLLSKLLVFAANPIKKTKSVSDLSAIKKAKQIINEKGSVGLFPEGNITYDGVTNKMSPSVVKLIRMLKRPVIFYNFEGLYFSNGRWTVYTKKGKSRGFIKKIISYEEYKDLSDDELFDIVKENLYVNAYDFPYNNFKGKEIAKGLERLVFIDYKSNEPFSTYTKGDMLYSKSSNLTLKFLNNGMVTDNENNSFNLIEIHEKVLTSYLNYYRNNKNFSFDRTVNLSKTDANKKHDLGKGSFTLKNDRVIFINKHIEKEFLFSEISNLAIQGKKQIIIYEDNDTWLFRFDLETSPYIYLLTYQFYNEGENIYDENISIHKFGLQ